MKYFKLLIVGFTVLMWLVSCRKQSTANWDVDLAVPVVNSKLNIRNFLGDSIFKSDNTGLLYLSVDREIANFKIDSLFNLPDTSIVQSFTIPSILATQTVEPGKPLTFFTPTDMTFDIGNGAKLKRADVRKCLLTVDFSNYFNQPIDMLYVIPSAKKNGGLFTISETVPPGKNTLHKTYDLAGYSLDLTGLNGKQFNTIGQTYTMTVNANASGPATYTGAVLGPSVSVAEVSLSYSKVVPDFVEGYFGQQVVDIPLDTASLGLNGNFKASNFLLSDATAIFKVENDIGAEFRANLSKVKAINTADKRDVPLQTARLNDININRALRSGNTIITGTNSITFNSANSNIAAFISNIPDRISSAGSLTVNPLNNSSGTNDFAFYNTGVRIRADINIPLRFTADYFTLTSNAPVDFSNVKQLDNVKGGNFVILAKNGYPFDARLQAYMLDVNNTVIDSLFISGANTLARGVINGLNFVESPTSSKILIPVTADKVTKLKSCKTIRIVTRILVPGSPPDTRIMENYEVDVNIVAELTYNVGT